MEIHLVLDNQVLDEMLCNIFVEFSFFPLILLLFCKERRYTEKISILAGRKLSVGTPVITAYFEQGAYTP